MNTLLIFLLAFAFRFLTTRDTSPGRDTFGHLYYAKEVRLQQAGIFGSIRTRALGSSEFRHPFLWHWLVSLFPIPLVLKYQNFLNPGLDALFTVLTFHICERIQSPQFAYITIAFYLTTPMWFSKLAMGPRIAGFTPRLSSEIATNILFIFLFVNLQLPPYISLCCATIIALYVLLSSKFGLQVLVFLLPLSALIAYSFIPTLVLASSFTMALVLSRGSFLQTAASQLQHLTWYFRKNSKGEVPVSGRNSLRKLFQQPTQAGGWRKHAQLVLFRMLSYNSLTAVLLKMPVAVVVWISLVSSDYHQTAFGEMVTPPIVAATFVYLCVNLPILLFLGEAERYLNHVAFFFCVAATDVLLNANQEWLILVLCIYGILYLLLEIFGLGRILDRERSQENAVVEFLACLGHKCVILCYPYDAVGTFRIMLETEHQVIDGYNANSGFSLYFEKHFAADYPYARLEEVNLMHSELNLNVLIARIGSLNARGFINWSPGAHWIQKELSSAPDYRIFVRRDTLMEMRT